MSTDEIPLGRIIFAHIMYLHFLNCFIPIYELNYNKSKKGLLGF